MKIRRNDFRLENLALMAVIIAYFIVVGAEVFGHVVVGRIAFEAPPRSFAMFEGPYGYDSGDFWAIFPPLTVLLFLVALATNWRTPRRAPILTSFGGFALIALVSMLYIYPQFRDIVYGGFRDAFDPELKRRAMEWTALAWTRWTVEVIFGLPLLIALGRPVSGEKEDAQESDSTL